MIHFGTFILALLLLVQPVQAADPWTKTNYALHGAYTAFMIADWQQTRIIAKNPDRLREKNPILGDHPSVGRVNTYFAASYAIGTAITHFLPAKYRLPFQIGITSGSGVVVMMNVSELKPKQRPPMR